MNEIYFSDVYVTIIHNKIIMNTVDIETIFDEMQYIVECFLVNIFHLIIEFDWGKNCCCKVCRKRAYKDRTLAAYFATAVFFPIKLNY